MKAAQRLLAGLSLALAVAGASRALANRYGTYTKRFATSPDQAKVLAATYLGGSGTEWLSSGGFAPDGRIVLVGNALGPQLELGAPTEVIGRDLAAPAAPPKRLPLMRRGQQRRDKQGNLLWRDFAWNHPGATGFVVHCSPDMRKVLSVHRFPWGSGGITDAAVAADGSIYVVGPASDAITRLARDCAALGVKDSGMKYPHCEHVYVARLSADGSRAIWVRHMKGKSRAPRVKVLRDGRIKVIGPDIRTFTPHGRLQAAVLVPGGLGGRTAVNPIDGTYARGGEHHWRTGREPWRCPVLRIYRPDGQLLYHLYDWGGPYVGLDNLRLVSDSAVRKVTYDDAGNLILYGWSDGGNSVFTREPNDVRSGAKNFRGLGMSAWGAGVLSVAYIIRIETADYKVAGGTVWLAYLRDKDKPNSIWIDTLGFGPDGSIGYAGRSAWGLIQTGNKLWQGDPAGPYVAVLNGKCDSLRFCSSMPACGKAEVGDGERWGIVAGRVGGRPRMLFVTGAIDKEELYGTTGPAPTRSAVQARYGGGLLDGYALLLDLSAAAPPATREAPAAAAGKQARGASSLPLMAAAGAGCALLAAAAFLAAPRRRRMLAVLLLAAMAVGFAAAPALAAKKKVEPAEGQTFHFHPDWPRWVTCDAEFRDPTGGKWPCFFYGRPDKEGHFRYSATKPEASFSVACDRMCQDQGDQSRRILGELVRGGKPPLVRFTATSMTPFRTEEVTETDARGRTRKRQVTAAEIGGVLQVGSRRAVVRGRCTARFKAAKGETQPNYVLLNTTFTVKGSALGLTAPGATGDINVRVSMSATTHKEPPKRKGR
jgi:hypothetical protein